MADKIICQCCCRQLVKSYDPTPNDKCVVSAKRAVLMFGNNYICHECAKDLDDIELFPEEKAFIDA